MRASSRPRSMTSPASAGTNVVDVYVSYLRKAIDAGFDLKLIETVHGRGYMLRGSSPE